MNPMENDQVATAADQSAPEVQTAQTQDPQGTVSEAQGDFWGMLQEVVKARKSTRVYSGKKLSDEQIAALRQAISDVSNPLDQGLRIELILPEECACVRLGTKSTYGVIKKAPAFLGGTIHSDKASLIAFGFAMESLVLRATSLGLGTCWLGGSFSRSDFSQAMRLCEGEKIPCVVAVGEPSSTLGIRDRLARTVGTSASRKDWSELFFDGEVGRPLSRDRADKACLALDLLRLAPSAMNGQPWRVVMTANGSRFEFFVQRRRNLLKKLVPSSLDFSWVDTGIAMNHFDLGARASLLEGSWSLDGPFEASVPDDFEPVAAFNCAQGSQSADEKTLSESTS